MSSSPDRNTHQEKERKRGGEIVGRGRVNLGAGNVSSVVECLSRLGFWDKKERKNYEMNE